jgi:nucleotide-binding universal stress UspA family protein
VGIGDPDHCGDALTFAFEEASLRQASLTAVHAWHAPQTDISRAGQMSAAPEQQAVAADAGSHLTALLEEWRAKYPDVPVSQEAAHGHPGRALIGLSARADLVVIGRHSGHQGPGSVRHAVLSHAHGPVVIIPSS